ncbi:MAG: YbdD/YjiX family protein [Candidatus Dechloromonas phosphoritropha]
MPDAVFTRPVSGHRHDECGGQAAAIGRADAEAAAVAHAGAEGGRYLGAARAQEIRRTLMAEAAAERHGEALRAASPLRAFAQRLAQALRLMVGVHDYEQYLAHQHAMHPQEQPLTREAFYRRCVDARYGGKRGGRAAGRCPCC